MLQRSHEDFETPRLTIVSELYYPEITSTGHLLTKLAEGLADGMPVRVVCAQPTYSRRGETALSREVRHGVEICRCWGTRFPKDRLPLRIVNAITITLTMFCHLLFSLRRGDRVLVVTNPPILPYAARLACGLRGVRCDLLVHDVYPECLIAAGFCSPDGWLSRFCRQLVRRLYRSMHTIVVLGRDMQRIVENAGGEGRTVIIPNFAEVDLVKPDQTARVRARRDLEIEDGQQVLLYAGNMGRTHDLETIIAAAAMTQDRADLLWVLAGWGAKRQRIEQEVARQNLGNVRIMDPYPNYNDLLNASDIGVIAFKPGMAGASVPCRMYNMLAVGKPIVAIADPTSELACVLREEQAGKSIAPGEASTLAEVVRAMIDDAPAAAKWGSNGRHAAVARYSLQAAISQYRQLYQSDVPPTLAIERAA